MAMQTQDMSKVFAANDLIPEGWYQGRIKAVDDDKVDTNNERRCGLQVAIQQPEDFVGQMVFDNPSLDNPMGLKTLKAYYKAVGYNPGPEGHDPQNLLDGEFWFYIIHNEDKKTGNTYANVAFWSIRALREGPGKNKPRK